jgi:[acyl-carrier-protein] S-malonyltransferase
LQDAIAATNFKDPVCPVYQNVNAKPSSNPDTIKENLIAQLTAPVRWTQSAREMASDGAVQFIECGPGKVLQGLIKKIVPEAEVSSL